MTRCWKHVIGHVFSVLLGILPCIGACGTGQTLQTQVSMYERKAADAKRNGAVRCAPRELAMAESHLKFAIIEYEQGFLLRAKEHLAIGAVNADAAYAQAVRERCLEMEGPKTDTEPAPLPDDTDKDGVLDNLDVCILEPEDKDNYLDEDGCPELDNDLDGIPDTRDKCPNEPEDPDGFEDDDGCPEADNDKDGVVDTEDQCPNEPGEATGPKKGCPNALVIVTDKEIRIKQQIHFEFNKDIVRKDSYAILDAVADVLRKSDKISLEIQGHTDNKGASEYNKRLSERRAASVMNYLIQRAAIPSSRLTSKGLGFDQPLCPNDTTLHRALNRRVQFLRTDTGKPPTSDMQCPP